MQEISKAALARNRTDGLANREESDAILEATKPNWEIATSAMHEMRILLPASVPKAQCARGARSPQISPGELSDLLHAEDQHDECRAANTRPGWLITRCFATPLRSDTMSDTDLRGEIWRTRGLGIVGVGTIR